MTNIDRIKQAKCLSHAARAWLPPAKSGNPVHPSVLCRWSDRGVLVNGQRVFLPTVRCGGQRMVTQEDVEKFLEALNQNNPSQCTTEPDDVARRGREACLALEKLGA